MSLREELEKIEFDSFWDTLALTAERMASDPEENSRMREDFRERCKGLGETADLVLKLGDLVGDDYDDVVNGLYIGFIALLTHSDIQDLDVSTFTDDPGPADS